ncbi:MAG: MOSC domain-containing protein [Acidimicrobiia bacterium]|nr:MOSC domain-containing protein [Acidimicrobiia bacterium]
MKQPTVVQINISPGGLPKRAIAEAIATPTGLEGDSWAHPNIHGGPKQALLLIARETIDDLKDRGYPLFYGALGENLTTDGLDPKRLRAGQRYRIGQEVIIELTKPRGPCNALDVYGASLKYEVYDDAVKARDPASPRWGMSGFYASVVTGGLILPGAPILLLDQAV